MAEVADIFRQKQRTIPEKMTDSDWRWLGLALGIVVMAMVSTRIVRWSIDRLLKRASEESRMDPTRFKFLKNAAALLIWLGAIILIVYTVPRLRTIAITLFAGAGILMAILGFAAQQAFSNIVSGIFIVIFRPFRVGDMIRVGQEHFGIVEDITLRHTVIIDFQNKRIIIPNAIISAETVVNDTIEDPLVCRWIEVGISYDSDIDLARQIMEEVCSDHPLNVDSRSPEEIERGVPRVAVRVMGFGDFSINLRAYCWTRQPTRGLEMHSDINIQIKKRFDEAGVEIPFPYRTIVYKNELPKRSTVSDQR